jgi:SPX domain protein involved in polyphosphate accumulation
MEEVGTTILEHALAAIVGAVISSLIFYILKVSKLPDRLDKLETKVSDLVTRLDAMPNSHVMKSEIDGLKHELFQFRQTLIQNMVDFIRKS